MLHARMSPICTKEVATVREKASRYTVADYRDQLRDLQQVDSVFASYNLGPKHNTSAPEHNLPNDRAPFEGRNLPREAYVGVQRPCSLRSSPQDEEVRFELDEGAGSVRLKDREGHSVSIKCIKWLNSAGGLSADRPAAGCASLDGNSFKVRECAGNTALFRELLMHQSAVMRPNPNLITLHGVQIIKPDPPRLAVITDACPRRTLGCLVTGMAEGRARWRVGALLSVLTGVTSALQHLHACSPPIALNNLGLQTVHVADGQAKLGDFSAAKFADLNTAASCRGASRLLGLGSRRMSAAPNLRYASPEALATAVVPDLVARLLKNADVHAFGVLLWQMLACSERPPHNVTAAAAQLVAAVHSDPAACLVTRNLATLSVACTTAKVDARPTANDLVTVMDMLRRKYEKK